MPTRTRAHRLDPESRRAFEDAIDPTFAFYSRPQPEYGIDGEVEEFDSEGRATGLQFFVQLKGTDEEDLGSALAVPVPLGTADYYRALPLPMLMVRWHAPTRRLYTRWFHQYDSYYGRGGKKTLTFRWAPSDAWRDQTPAALAADARAFLELRHASVGLPRPCHAVTQGAFGFDPAELQIAFRTVARERADIIDVRAGDPSPGAMWVEMGDEAIVANLAKVTAAALHLAEEERPRDAHSVAVDALTLVALAFERVGQDTIASRLTATYLTRSSLARNRDAAAALAAAMLRADRIADALTLADELDDPSDPLASQASLMFLTPALHRGGTLDAAVVTQQEQVLHRRAKRRKDARDDIEAGRAYMNLATFHRAHSNWAKAVSFYELAARYDPGYLNRAHYWYEYGGALWGTRQFLKGADAYARSIALGTERPLAPALQADCLLFAGRYKEATELFVRYNATHVDGDGEYRLKERATRAIVDRLRITQQRRRTKQAVQVVKADATTEEEWTRQSVAQLREDALWGSAWFNLAVSDRDYGDPTDALTAFIASTILMPGDLEAWQNAIVMAFTLEDDAALVDLVVTGRRMTGDDLITWLLEVTRVDNSGFPRDEFVAKLDKILAENAPPSPGGFTVRVINDSGSVEEIVVGEDDG